MPGNDSIAICFQLLGIPSAVDATERQQIFDTRVAFAKDPFMDEPENANVPPKAQGSEIVIQKSAFFRDAQVPNEIGLSPVKTSQTRSACVANSPVLIFDQTPDMIFKLIQHVTDAIKSTGAEKSLDFRPDAIENEFDCISYSEFHVKQNAKEHKVVTFTSIRMDYNNVFFRRVEDNSISLAPPVDFGARGRHICLNGQVVQRSRRIF